MSGNWLETIAAKTELPLQETSQRLRKWGIVPDRVARPAPSFIIKRLAFSGDKKGEIVGRIDLDWDGLGPGVWAVTSETNLRGKSSVLEIILWCLRGKPKGLQDDVRSWLSHVVLEFCIDAERYRVSFDLLGGKPNGRLERLDLGGAYHELERFTSDEGFALVMAQFMMDTLDLDVLTSMQGGEGVKKKVEHGWPALSNVFYLGGEHKVLLGGDAEMAGLPARIFQMYVGLPWASTKAHVTTAKKELDQRQANAARETQRFEAEAKAAQERLEQDIVAARAQLATLPTEMTTAEALRHAGQSVTSATIKMAELQTRAAKADADAEKIIEVSLEDERAVRDLRESIVATRFFNGLKPKCCPRCETEVPTTRIRAEVSDLACSLCAEAIPENLFEDVSEELEAAEAQAIASKSAADRAKATQAEARTAANEATKSLGAAQAQLAEVVRGSDFAAKREAELELARLEGALRERSMAPKETLPDPDAELIAVAEKETAKAYDMGRTGIIDALNAEILPLARRLGIEALESVKLDSGGKMKVEKGGTSTSFTKVTAGERLRLQLATAIALLRVGRKLGIGRHPGLLVIDSPSKEEVSKVNLEALLAELRTIAEEIEALQVIVAGTDLDEIVGALGEEHCLIARGKEYVW
ncbi:hypothetical protein HJ526_05230 [Donghicola sp. C2-DW-16]|uniref:Large ATP-binding protein n=1 Tax=Donghicola mangrovi TaxID=2729614 RepID=A0ABX2PCX3_9RHOB|nr:hypothetical protein [Donghicola mangrovi]NVO26811.1 hypothetical protein [Donghicola mangrovi]